MLHVKIANYLINALMKQLGLIKHSFQIIVSLIALMRIRYLKIIYPYLKM